MTGAMIAFGIVIGIALSMCHRVMTRWSKRRVINGSSADRSGPIDNDVSDTGNHFAWSADENPAFAHSGAASDSAGTDSEGGGDAGGGADGSGGGGD